eukprot:403363774
MQEKNHANILKQFKFDPSKLEKPRSFSNYKAISVQNQIKEQEETLTKLQDKMVEFYFFLNGTRLPKGSNLDREKERYQKMPIMLIFDYLKGFFFKIQNENEELKHQIDKIEKGDQINHMLRGTSSGNPFSAENEQYLKDLKAQIEKLQFENSKGKMELEKTLKELSDIRQSKKQALDTSHVIIQEIKLDNERLLKVIEDIRDQIEIQKKDLQDRDIHIEKLKEKLIDSSKLQQKVKLLENKYVSDINHIKVQNFKEVQDKKKGDSEHSKLMALNNVKDERIQFLENEIKSFRDRITSDRSSQMQVSKLSYKAEMNEKITRKSEHEIARLKIRIEEKDRYIEKVKKDFDRVFEELKKYKKDADKANKFDSNQMQPGTIHSHSSSQQVIPYISVDKNPYLLEEYQRRVREQEQVISSMRKKFKRMNLTEKKGYIKQKEFEMQRFEYERQIQDMKKITSDKRRSNVKLGYLSNGGVDTDSSLDERQDQQNFHQTPFIKQSNIKVEENQSLFQHTARSSSIQKMSTGVGNKLNMASINGFNGSVTQRNFKTAAGHHNQYNSQRDQVSISNTENIKALQDGRLSAMQSNEFTERSNTKYGSQLKLKSLN